MSLLDNGSTEQIELDMILEIRKAVRHRKDFNYSFINECEYLLSIGESLTDEQSDKLWNTYKGFVKNGNYL